MGSKGGGQSSSTGGQTSGATSGTTAQDLPPWLTGAAQQAVGTAQTLSQNPNLFAQYGGQQVADVGQGTQAAWNAINSTTPQQTAAQIGSSAGDIYGSLFNASLPNQAQFIANGLNSATGAYTSGLQNAQNALNSGLNSAQGLLGGWAGIGPISAQQIAQNAQSMMSPYTQAVIDPTLALGQQALTQNLQQIGAGANQAGAFGGSRQGVQEGVAQSQAALGESNILGQLLNTGYNTSLTAANQLGMQTQQLGENAASTLGQMYGNAGNEMAGLYGTAGNTLAQLQAQAGGQLAGYSQQDISNALSAGQGLPQQYLGNLSAMGAQQQSQQQALLNAQMGNFYGAQQQPIQNLDVLLSTLGGVPYGTTTTQNASNLNFGNQAVANQRNPLTGALGGAATGAAIGTAFGPIGTGVGAIGGGLLGALG